MALPDSDVLGETRAAALGGPLARALREETPQQEVEPKEEPPKPKRVPRLRRKPAPEPVAPMEPVQPAAVEPVAPMEPVQPVAPKEPIAAVEPAAAVEPVVIPPAEPERSRRAPRLTRKPDSVPAVSAPAPSTPEIDDARAHEAALETFIRLTESDRQHAETAEVDQGAVRAALARTAARKKPGGHRLQPHDRPGETQGGPPRRS